MLSSRYVWLSNKHTNTFNGLLDDFVQEIGAYPIVMQMKLVHNAKVNAFIMEFWIVVDGCGYCYGKQNNTNAPQSRLVIKTKTKIQNVFTILNKQQLIHRPEIQNERNHNRGTLNNQSINK